MLASALLLAGPAPARAADFPCRQFDRAMEQARASAARMLAPAARRAADRAIADVVAKVDEQRCDSFRYRRVHRWLRHEWHIALEARREGGDATAQEFGRSFGLEPAISFVERAARDDGVFLRPIRKAGDE